MGRRALEAGPRQSICLAAVIALLTAWPVASSPEPPAEPDMVRLEGGEFAMGQEGHGDYSPAHTVQLSPFYIDRYEVTNAQYQRFCEETGRALPFFWGIDRFCSGPEFPNHPVVGVSQQDAADYAAWRGARLPTEAEWEYAARGGLVGKNYSHGDVYDSTLYVRTGGRYPLPVGSRPPNGFGLHDMIGNVCEWVQDRFDDEYYAASPAADPRGPYVGDYRVIRGGGYHTGPFCSRVYMRYGLKSNWLDFNVGFRCARYAGESAAERLEEILRGAGAQAGSSAHREMRAAEPGTWFFDEGELNEMGYRLLGDSLVAEAIAVFEFNVEAHPSSYNAHDSLAEACAALGERDRAIGHYRRALELNPACRTARQGLERLGED